MAGWLGSNMHYKCVSVAGFFTDDLTIHNDIAGGGGKYLGVCQLPGEGRKVRVQTITMTIIRLNQNMGKRGRKFMFF